MNISESYIILMHKYAAEHINTGFAPRLMMSYLKENGIDLNNENIKSGVINILREIVHGQHNIDVSEDDICFMLSSSYYRYVEYLEFLETKKNSKETKKLSIIAICIASTLALVQILVALS